jgi:hypothetical protein
MTTYRKILLAGLLIVLGSAVFGQTKKEILGTFEIGCKVFNYNFSKNPNGLYSFRIEFAETETLLHFADIDSLKNTKPVLISAIKTLSDTIGQNTKPENKDQVKADSLRRDSLLIIKEGLTGFIDDVINENNTLDYIYSKKDHLKGLIKITKKLALNTAWGNEKNIYTIDSLIRKIETVITSAVSIVETKTYPMNVFEQDPFQAIVKEVLDKRKSTFLPECISSEQEVINKRATALFFEIKSRLDFQDDEPSTAYLKLKNTFVKCYLDNHRRIRYHENQDKNNTQLQNGFLIEDITVEFEDGTIKNIFADLRVIDKYGIPVSGNAIRFKNVSPISISTKTDPDVFEKIKIFVGESSRLKKEYNLKKVESAPAEKKFALVPKNGESKDVTVVPEEYLYFYLSDILDYSIIADNDREDYSPANIVVHLNKQTPTIELKKEKRSKILTVRAFTDFIGIQDEEPNGLIQVEALKRINFNTAKYGRAFVYHSFFSYVEPVLAFSKIEKNKNALPLGPSDLDQTLLQTGEKSFILQPIELYQYQKSSFDVSLNLWKVNFPEIKSNLQINTSLGIFKTNVVDTILVTNANGVEKSPEPNFTVLNTLRWGFTAIWEIKPENRYGIVFGWDRRRLNLLNEGFSITADSTKKTNILNTAWVEAFLKTNDNAKLFFRYRFTFEDNFAKRNFTQIQLGYLMDLFKTKK